MGFFFFSFSLPPLIPLVKVIQCGAVSSTLIARAVALIAQIRFIFTLFFYKGDQHHATCFLLTGKMVVPVGVQGKC